MINWSRMWKLLFATGIIFLMAGCSVNDNFVYKPSAPAAGVRQLPVKVAVIAFKDSTESFTSVDTNL